MMKSILRSARFVLMLALPACGGDCLIAPVEGTGNTRVTVVNDGTLALTSLRIRTSERDTLPLIGSLAAGQTMGTFAVGTLHSAPLVHATVQGRAIIANPVEGFAGFNPALADGAYVVRIRAAPDNNALDIRVSPAAP